jgi:hypothetical protein
VLNLIKYAPQKAIGKKQQKADLFQTRPFKIEEKNNEKKWKL